MCRKVYGCACQGACNAGLFGFLFWGFNFAFFAFGATMLGIGIALLVDMPDLGKDSESLEGVLIATITLGSLIFVIGFLGCCAVTRDNRCFLTLYTILVTSVIGFQITLIFLAEFLVTIPDDMAERWDDALLQYQPPPTGEDDRPRNSILIDELQVFSDCCGVAGPQDWTNNPNFTPLNPVPLSCCAIVDEDDPEFPTQRASCFLEATSSTGETYLRRKGCAAAWEDQLNHYSEIVIITLSIFAACQVAGVLFAICLRGKIGNQAAVATVA